MQEKAIQIIDPVCPNCGNREDALSARFVELIKQDDGSFKAKGQGTLDPTDYTCSTCGFPYNALSKQLPILAKDISCPKCKAENTSIIEIENVKLVSDEKYTFLAKLMCPICARGKPVLDFVKKALSKLAFSIGPAGITVKSK